MKNLFLSLAATALAASIASAGDCATCSGGGGGYAPTPRTWGPKAHKYERFQGWFHSSSSQAKPAVAPWYNYWPYNGQFMTPGPIGGAPNGGGLVNPYFPGN